MQDGTLNHPGINTKDGFYCAEVGRGPSRGQDCSVIHSAVLRQLSL